MNHTTYVEICFKNSKIDWFFLECDQCDDYNECPEIQGYENKCTGRLPRPSFFHGSDQCCCRYSVSGASRIAHRMTFGLIGRKGGKAKTTVIREWKEKINSRIERMNIKWQSTMTMLGVGRGEKIKTTKLTLMENGKDCKI